MTLALAQAYVAAAVLVLLLVPGWAIVRIAQLDKLANPWLRLPLMATCGSVAAAPPSAISVAVGTGIRGYVLLFAGWTALLLASAVWRRPRSASTRAIARARTAARASDRSTSAAGVPRAALAAVGTLSALCALVAGVRGTAFRSDSAVHASIVEKLAHLPHARWNELGVVDDGRALDSAIVPLWHHLLALAALPFDRPGILAVWSAGAAVAGLVPWGAAALGWAAVRTHAGAALAAALSTAMLLVPWDGSVPQLATFLGYPGSFVLHVVLPAALALVVECIDDEARVRRAALRALVLATFAVALLHLTYLYLLAVAATAMAMLLATLRPRAIRRLAVPAAAVACVSAIVLAETMPVLSRAHQFGRGAGDAGMGHLAKQWSGITTVGGASVVPGYFLEAGGIALAGLLLATLVLPLVHRRNVAGAMLSIGPLLLLGAAARTDVVAGFVSGLGSFPPVPRSYRAIPWVLPTVVVLHELDRSLAARGIRRTAAAAIGAAAAIAAVLLAWLLPGHLAGRDQPSPALDPPLPGWSFDAVLAVLALELAVVVALQLRRRRAAAGMLATTAGGDPPPIAETVASAEPVATAGTAATATPARARSGLVAAAAGVLVAASIVATVVHLPAQLDDRPADLLRADGLFGERFATDATLDVIDSLHPRATVVTEAGAALRVTAVAPVYVTYTKKQSYASLERKAEYVRFGSPDEPDWRRMRYLRRNDVQAVLLPLSPPMREAMVRSLGARQWERIEQGGELVGWRRRA